MEAMDKAPDLTSFEWRTGRTLGRTLYARTGGADWKADTVIGMLDTRELAEAACSAHNEALARRREPATVHVWTTDGTFTTACCGLAPNDIPVADRVTHDPEAVTCDGPKP